ncbi:MAG: hypothetical protein L6R41_002366 [Letrouitia leprolyta]|nr:MAG: hypothetical protein L6R41_002366 [Letrouitia leprolyta]
MSQGPPFGVILPSRPVFTNAVTVSATQVAFILPVIPSFSHVVVFLTPGNPLPPGHLAGVYIQFPSMIPEFKLLGAISNEKQSAIFQVKNGNLAMGTNDNQDGTEDMMTDTDGPNAFPNGTPYTAGLPRVTIGISVEPAATIEAQLASSSLVVANRTTQQQSPVPTKVLAQRIIKNAFNFLASFAGQTTVGGEEMVPLRSFQGWWEKFERRVENDPGFLERDVDG